MNTSVNTSPFEKNNGNGHEIHPPQVSTTQTVDKKNECIEGLEELMSAKSEKHKRKAYLPEKARTRVCADCGGVHLLDEVCPLTIEQSEQVLADLPTDDPYRRFLERVNGGANGESHG